jgi:hypothetical protein
MSMHRRRPTIRLLIRWHKKLRVDMQMCSSLWLQRLWDQASH